MAINFVQVYATTEVWYELSIVYMHYQEHSKIFLLLSQKNRGIKVLNQIPLEVIAGASCTLDALPYCMQLLTCACKSNSNQCNFVYSSRTVGVGSLSMCTIWACATSFSLMQGWYKKLWHACFRDFARVTVYLVVQMDLSRWKVVCCGQLTLHWTLDRWQWQSKLANHSVTSFKLKI